MENYYKEGANNEMVNNLDKTIWNYQSVWSGYGILGIYICSYSYCTGNESCILGDETKKRWK